MLCWSVSGSQYTLEKKTKNKHTHNKKWTFTNCLISFCSPSQSVSRTVVSMGLGRKPSHWEEPKPLSSLKNLCVSYLSWLGCESIWSKSPSHVIVECASSVQHKSCKFHRNRKLLKHSSETLSSEDSIRSKFQSQFQSWGKSWSTLYDRRQLKKAHSCMGFDNRKIPAISWSVSSFTRWYRYLQFTPVVIREDGCISEMENLGHCWKYERFMNIAYLFHIAVSAQ